MSEELLVVIRAFQADVAHAVVLLESSLGTPDRAEQRQRVMAQDGFVDAGKKHRCSFHGIGCRLQLSRDRVIDWDYGHGGRIDGFDLWRLTNFLRSRRKLQRVLSLDALDDAFRRAYEAGAIVRHPRARYDNLFYLATDLETADEEPEVDA